MMTLNLTHLAAAIVPLILIFLATRVIKKIQYIRYRNDFWNRQSTEALKKIGFWDIKGLPATPEIITGRDS